MFEVQGWGGGFGWSEGLFAARHDAETRMVELGSVNYGRDSVRANAQFVIVARPVQPPSVPPTPPEYAAMDGKGELSVAD